MFWKKASTCALGVIIAAALFEVAVRFTPFVEKHMITFDSHRGWALLPGAEELFTHEGRGYVKINRDGLRDVDHVKEKPPNTFRIAVLGDSYAEADQIDMRDAFWWVMQSRLRACPALAGKQVEAINFGVRGYGTAQELFSLRYHGWQYSPDFAVLAVYIGNDIENNSLRLESNKCRPFFVERGGRFMLGGPFADSALFHLRCRVRYVSRYSQASNVMGDAVMRVRNELHERMEPHAAAPAPRDGQNLGASWPVNPVYVEARDPVWDAAWRVTDAEITMTAREAQSRHVGFLAVTLSDAFQVYPDQAVRAVYAKRLGVADLFYPERRISALGRREGFAVLTLAPTLQRYADENHAYVHGFNHGGMGSGHWNTLGHRLGGELIAGQICAMISRDGAAAQAAAANSSR